MLFGTCAVGLCDIGGCVCCEGTAPKLMLMLGNNARSPSCQSFIDSCDYNTKSLITLYVSCLYIALISLLFNLCMCAFIHIGHTSKFHPLNSLYIFRCRSIFVKLERLNTYALNLTFQGIFSGKKRKMENQTKYIYYRKCT